MRSDACCIFLASAAAPSSMRFFSAIWLSNIFWSSPSFAWHASSRFSACLSALLAASSWPIATESASSLGLTMRAAKK